MHPRDTKERLLQAAENLLLHHGWEALSIRRIGAALGLSSAALYRHFPNLEALKNEMVHRRYRHFLDFVAQTQASEGQGADPRRRLLLAGLAYLKFWAAQPRWFDLYRDWVDATGALAYRDETEPAAPDPLGQDLARCLGAEGSGGGVRRAVWAMNLLLFGLAQAVRAEQSLGQAYDEERCREVLETWLGGLTGVRGFF